MIYSAYTLKIKKKRSPADQLYTGKVESAEPKKWQQKWLPNAASDYLEYNYSLVWRRFLIKRNKSGIQDILNLIQSMKCIAWKFGLETEPGHGKESCWNWPFNGQLFILHCVNPDNGHGVRQGYPVMHTIVHDMGIAINLPNQMSAILPWYVYREHYQDA